MVLFEYSLVIYLHCHSATVACLKYCFFWQFDEAAVKNLTITGDGLVDKDVVKAFGDVRIHMDISFYFIHVFLIRV